MKLITRSKAIKESGLGGGCEELVSGLFIQKQSPSFNTSYARFLRFLRIAYNGSSKDIALCSSSFSQPRHRKFSFPFIALPPYMFISPRDSFPDAEPPHPHVVPRLPVEHNRRVPTGRHRRDKGNGGIGEGFVRVVRR